MGRKKAAEKEKPRTHREFYVNDRLEFSLYFDPAITDKKQIIDEFLKSKDFLFMRNYCNWKVKDTSISDDLLKVHVTVEVLKD